MCPMHHRSLNRAGTKTYPIKFSSCPIYIQLQRFFLMAAHNDTKFLDVQTLDPIFI